MRRLGSKKQKVVSVAEAVAELSDEIRNRGRST
jgi:hypothetical protein